MKCPHCLHLFHEQWKDSYIGDGPEGSLYTSHQTCPGCSRSIVYLQFRDRFNSPREEKLVYPKGTGRTPLPSEVKDQKLIEDYTEAVLVLADSAKASAAISRRSLQHVLREKAGVKKSNLSSEIQEVLDSGILPSDIAENLDAVRNVGNFAAHPIKSTSTGEIVEVEPHEAEWNLDVLEQVIDYYYVRPAIAKKKREDLNKKLADAGKPSVK